MKMKDVEWTLDYQYVSYEPNFDLLPPQKQRAVIVQYIRDKLENCALTMYHNDKDFETVQDMIKEASHYQQAALFFACPSNSKEYLDKHHLDNREALKQEVEDLKHLTCVLSEILECALVMIQHVVEDGYHYEGSTAIINEAKEMITKAGDI